MVAALIIPTMAGVQAQRPRTEESAARLAENSERAPLFAATEPLTVTLEADLDDLQRDRDEALEREGSLTFRDLEGRPITVSVQLTTRGDFRRNRRNCNFPPLLLNLPRGRIAGTIFGGQNKLKLVSPCNDERDDYQRYVLLEYLLYRTFNVLTPVSFRVRLLNVTFKDSSGKHQERTRHSFVIEDVDRMAERHMAEESDWPQFHPHNMEARQATIVDFFQYMIGNTDWSAPYFHNVKMIRAAGPTYLVVPFDFDFAGAVDANYATPDATLGIRNVRQRVYRGFCRDGLDYTSIVSLFNERKDDIHALVRGFDPLNEEERQDLIEYYDGFYDIINNPGRLRREIVNACRPVGV
jgi:hypothetical protein